MPDQDANTDEQNSSSAPDAQAEPSPAEPQAGGATPQQAAGGEIPFHEHPRWKEVLEERDYWRNQALQQRPTGQPAQPVSQEPDLYAGMDPQTRVFYQDLDTRNKKIFEKMVTEKEGNYQSTIQALIAQNAKIQEKLFRQEYKDIAVNSPEESKIASYIRAGLDPDTAYWAVMGKQKVQELEGKKQSTQQQKIQQKAQANIESHGLPSRGPLKQGESLSFREDLDRKMRVAGY